jgi:hypothetical protein
MAKRISTRRKASRSHKTSKRIALKHARIAGKNAKRKAKLTKRLRMRK